MLVDNNVKLKSLGRNERRQNPHFSSASIQSEHEVVLFDFFDMKPFSRFSSQ